MKKKAKFSPFLLGFVKVTAILPVFIYFKPRKMYESGKKPDFKKGAIIVSNHVKLVDFLLMLLVFPFNAVRFMIAEVIFNKSGALARFLERLGSIRIDRNDATGAGYIRETEEALKKKHVIGIFPEGRLNTEPEKELLPFKTGAAYLALKFGAPIVPVYHGYKYGLFRRTDVMIGDEIDLSGMFAELPDGERINKATEYLRKRIAELKELAEKREKERTEKKHSTRFYKMSSAFIFTTTRWAYMIGFRPVFHYVDKSAQARKLPPHAIVVANHSHYFDPPMVCTVFPKDKPHMIAGEILYDIPILHWLLPHYGCIRIDRNAIDMESFRAMNSTLKKGECIGLFPEGMLNKTDELLPFKSGMVLSALMTKSPIVPIYISGDYRVFGKRMHIVIDKPFELDYSTAMTGENLDKIAADIRLRMIELKQYIN